MNLARAVELAEARKRAVLNVDDESGVFYSDGELQDRCVFSGLDVDYDELTHVAIRAGEFFDEHTVARFELQSLFTAAWCDGLLTGLLAAQEDHASHE